MLDVLKEFLSYVRNDIHAERRQAQDRTWIYKDIPRPITDEDLKKHLSTAGPHLGVYIMKPGEDTTTIALFDVDDHDESAGFDKVLGVAHALCRTARKFGLEPWVARSGSGHGVHVFFRWDEPQKAKHVRSMLKEVLLLSGFKPGASQHGVNKDEVDVFPKQDSLKDKSHGSLVALPFGRSSCPLDARLEDAKEPEPWLSSKPVKPVREEKKEERQDTADQALVKEALSCVGSEDWQTWVRVGLALKHAFKDEGFGMWNEWSSTAGNYAGERGCLMEWNRFRPNGSITLGTVFHLAKEGGWVAPEGKGSAKYSDAWCADEFATSHGEDFRYVTESKDWMIFEGSTWRPMHRLEMFEKMKRECKAWSDDAKKGKKSELNSSKKHSSVVYMLRLTWDRRGNRVATSQEDWDREPMLVGTPLGVLDLQTEEVKTDRSLLVSMATNAAPGGDAPKWRSFLKDICKGDEEVEAFLQRFAGYCLTGSTEEEKMLILYGPGGNGKSALVETLVWLLGDYGTTLSANALLVSRGMGDRHPTELAKLHRKRLAVASETLEGSRFNTALIKNLTGGDRITARFMRQDEFEFDPTHKTVLCSNQLPLLGNVDRAVERRILMVRLDAQFDKPDTQLKRKLRNEAGGVMAWCMEGFREWRKRGLDAPRPVLEATQDYLKNQDDLQLFIGDCCSLGKNYEQLSSDLYDAWRGWARQHGAYEGSQRAFSQRLQARGFPVRHTRNGSCFTGIKIGLLGPQAAQYESDTDMF